MYRTHFFRVSNGGALCRISRDGVPLRQILLVHIFPAMNAYYTWTVFAEQADAHQAAFCVGATPLDVQASILLPSALRSETASNLCFIHLERSLLWSPLLFEKVLHQEEGDEYIEGNEP